MNDCIILENYEKLEIKGAKKIVSATSTQAVVETENKTIILTGSNIEITNLDLDNSLVSLTGTFSNLKFSIANAQKPSFFKRIFK